MNKIIYLCFVVLFCLSFQMFSQTSEIQRVRIDFVTPLGYTRHLMLAFTQDNVATDDFDYGYDALVFDDFPDDLNWIIEGDRYIIQGVGAFENSKYYPLGMFLSNSGQVKIKLRLLENFEYPIPVYVYDTVLDTFTPISDADYIKSLTNGDYLDRFYITFSNDKDIINMASSSKALTVGEHELQQTSFNYIRSTEELVINTNTITKLNQVLLYDIMGKRLMAIDNIDSSSINIPLANLKTSGPFIVRLLTEDGKHLNKHIIAGL